MTDHDSSDKNAPDATIPAHDSVTGAASEPIKPIEPIEAAADTDTDARRTLSPDDAQPVRTTLTNPVDAVRRAIAILEDDQLASTTTRLPHINADTPWILQQFFKGEIDLEAELGKRFPALPMMSTVKFRTLGTQSGRHVATLSAQDGSTSVMLEADKHSKVVQMSFTVASMLTLRFSLADLSHMDRKHWLELMRRDEGGLAFLWGSQRWARDYLICISRRYYSNLYAFSPSNFEAAIRITPPVMAQLLDWLQDVWQSDAKTEGNPPDLLTW